MTLVSGNVLVTGATGGLGQAIARAFAARGASLMLTGRRAEVLVPLAEELSGRAIACDLSRRDHVDRLVSDVGDVDVFVANAGLPATGLLTDLQQEQIDRMLEVNLRAPVALARGLAPAMIARGQGHMVFISSLMAKSTASASSMYSATKAGVRAFALALREDLRPAGVGVSVILPSFIRDAGMFADSGARLPRWVGTRTPEDVAEAVIRAIEQNRPEVEVAPVSLRVGANFSGVAPGVAAAVSRRMGSEKIAADFADGQRDKR